MPHWCWQVADNRGWAESAIARRYGPLLARALWSRCWRDPEACAAWLTPHSTALGGWQQLPNLATAIARIRQALAAGQPIGVYGDYDVDGITATAIAVLTLQSLGGQVLWRLPDRLREGYGLHVPAVEEMAARLHDRQSTGRPLLLVLDCGTSNRAEIALAAELGLDVVVLDHHSLPSVLPDALVLVNPRCLPEGHPCADLTAAGLSLYLAQGLLETSAPGDEAGQLTLKRDLIGLAALGTIADVAVLTGENRTLVARGLRALRHRQRAGIAALLAQADIAPDRVDVDGLSWRVAPRLNAAGRMEHPEPALRLLLTENEVEAAFLATHLNLLNTRRQAELERLVGEAREQATTRLRRVLVLAGADWSPGLVGLVASRMTEEFGRPSIVLGYEDELARGSARSVAGFNITQALAECGALLRRYGGHAQAAGLTIERQHVEALAEQLDAVAARGWPDGPPSPVLRLDDAIGLADLAQPAVQELNRLAPFGRGNEEPLWLVGAVRPLDARVVGRQGQHLQFRASDGRTMRRCIAFGLGSRLAEVQGSERVDLAATVRLDEWQGSVEVKLFVRDLRPATSGDR